MGIIDDSNVIILSINGNPRSFDAVADISGFTVAQLVVKLGLEGKRLAIERNGEIVPRGAFGP